MKYIEFEYEMISGANSYKDVAAVRTIDDALCMIENWNRQNYNDLYRYKFIRVIGQLSQNQIKSGTELYSSCIPRLVAYNSN